MIVLCQEGGGGRLAAARRLGAQYGFIEEYSLNYITDPEYDLSYIPKKTAVLGSLGRLNPVPGPFCAHGFLELGRVHSVRRKNLQPK